MKKTVYVVHCIDTEGPLYESIDATFQRLKQIFNLDLKPSRELLKKLQQGKVDLNGLEKSVQKVVSPQIINYNDNWQKIDSMLTEVLSKEFRNRYSDSLNNGWIYNWFCVDHVDYSANPRKREIGYHKIFDHYQKILKKMHSSQDDIQFHYHPHAFISDATLTATHWWVNSNSLYDILNRRIIDRNWFPSVNRPGFHVTRPDSHWFLEQFIPFDYSNQSCEQSKEDKKQSSLGGRWGDWRRAPKNWSPYHPAHDDYQKSGECRRWIARCMNIGTRMNLLNQKYIDQAFRETDEGKPVVLSFTNHDFRDIRTDIDKVYKMIKKTSDEYPDIDFSHSNAVQGIRNALNLPKMKKCVFDLKLERIKTGFDILTVKTESPTFGPQPFFSFKTKDGSYYHDNLDFQVPNHEWSYIFDENTFQINKIEKIGVAANNSYGITSVSTIDLSTGKIKNVYYNDK